MISSIGGHCMRKTLHKYLEGRKKIVMKMRHKKVQSAQTYFQQKSLKMRRKKVHAQKKLRKCDKKKGASNKSFGKLFHQSTRTQVIKSNLAPLTLMISSPIKNRPSLKETNDQQKIFNNVCIKKSFFFFFKSLLSKTTNHHHHYHCHHQISTVYHHHFYHWRHLGCTEYQGASSCTPKADQGSPVARAIPVSGGKLHLLSPQSNGGPPCHLTNNLLPPCHLFPRRRS